MRSIRITLAVSRLTSRLAEGNLTFTALFFYCTSDQRTVSIGETLPIDDVRQDFIDLYVYSFQISEYFATM